MRAHVKRVAVSLCVLAASLVAPPSGLAAEPGEKVYTTSGDFAEGNMVGLNDDIPDQLQLDSDSATFPFIWVANSDEGTVSKLDTETGDELGRYRSAPNGTGSNPSRTTVDQDGNVWVGNRNSNTISKIGLSEAGNCIDRNGNGTIETSTGGTDVKGWPSGADPEDECILLHVLLGSNPSQDTYVRAVAIDADNNVFAGMSIGPNVYHVDGQTGDIIQRFTQPFSGNYPSYGAVVDQEGNLWIAAAGNYAVVKHTFNADGTYAARQTVSLPGYGYGMAVDGDGYLWVSGWTHQNISKVRTEDGTVEATYNLAPYGVSGLRGVAATDDGDIWVAASYSNNVIRLNSDGTREAVIPVGSHPTGVAVDDEGKVWVTNYYSHDVSRIDPDSNTVDDTFPVGRGPYNYSDMTGSVIRNITTKQGTWTVTHDGGTPGMAWSTISWNGDEPAGTALTGRVKAADSVAALGSAPWVDVANGVPMADVTGQYLRVEMKLTTETDGVTPVLYDVTLQPEGAGGGECTEAPALAWNTASTVPEYDSLDIGFTWRACGEHVRDESVAIRVRNAATNALIAGFVYGEQITIDDDAGEYHLTFVPEYYQLPAGTRLKVMAYFGTKLKGTTFVDVVPAE